VFGPASEWHATDHAWLRFPWVHHAPNWDAQFGRVLASVRLAGSTGQTHGQWFRGRGQTPAELIQHQNVYESNFAFCELNSSSVSSPDSRSSTTLLRFGISFSANLGEVVLHWRLSPETYRQGRPVRPQRESRPSSDGSLDSEERA